MTEETKMILEAMQDIAGQLNKEIQGVKTEIKEMKERLTNVENLAIQNALTMENELKPNIILIAEQHTTLVDNYNTVSERVDKNEADIDIVKMHIKKIDVDVQELKKAN
jgi:chromosome segregation ATPase